LVVDDGLGSLEDKKRAAGFWGIPWAAGRRKKKYVAARVTLSRQEENWEVCS